MNIYKTKNFFLQSLLLYNLERSEVSNKTSQITILSRRKKKLLKIYSAYENVEKKISPTKQVTKNTKLIKTKLVDSIYRFI